LSVVVLVSDCKPVSFYFVLALVQQHYSLMPLFTAIENNAQFQASIIYQLNLSRSLVLPHKNVPPMDITYLCEVSHPHW
jgi:hypothetical protein